MVKTNDWSMCIKLTKSASVLPSPPPAQFCFFFSYCCDKNNLTETTKARRGLCLRVVEGHGPTWEEEMEQAGQAQWQEQEASWPHCTHSGNREQTEIRDR